MSTIVETISAIPKIDDPQFAVWLEDNLRRMQREIYLLRQVVEPIVKHQVNTPETVGDALT